MRLYYANLNFKGQDFNNARMMGKITSLLYTLIYELQQNWC